MRPCFERWPFPTKVHQDASGPTLSVEGSIPQLEKKLIKRIKLVGTLTDSTTTRKIKLKPEMARKKDLNKIDDFLLTVYRTLNALNGKRRTATAEA